jgi:hypothetical protein
MTETKTVNGQRFRKFDTGEENLARQFCAALPRGGNPAILEVANRGGRGIVTVHLRESTDADCERLPIPDGFKVERVSVTSSGGHFVAVKAADD